MPSAFASPDFEALSVTSLRLVLPCLLTDVVTLFYLRKVTTFFVFSVTVLKSNDLLQTNVITPTLSSFFPGDHFSNILINLATEKYLDFS